MGYEARAEKARLTARGPINQLIDRDEMSRRHALVKPTPDGISVEDLGSSNGTYINNKRVQQGFLHPGDELRLDAVRFILVAPGLEMAPQAPAPAKQAPAKHASSQKLYMMAAAMVTVAAVAIIVLMVLTKK